MSISSPLKPPDCIKEDPFPAGYVDPPDPYSDPPKSRYNLRAMVNYAFANNKDVCELTKEEIEQFAIN